MKLRIFNPLERLYHKKVIIVGLLFHYSLLNRSKVFLVGEVDVVEKWALTWQEGAGHLKRLRMPKFRLCLLLGDVPGGVLLHLNDKSDFSRVAEIGDG